MATRTKVKKKQSLSTEEKLKRLRKIRGMFPKEVIPDPVAWQRKHRRDRKIV